MSVAIPTKLKELQGNPGKRPLNKKEPKAAPGIPIRPSYVKGEAKKEWNKVIKEIPKGVLTKSDRSMLALYCVAMGSIIDLVNEGKPVQPPLMLQCRALASEFGLSPSSRARMTVEPTKEVDPFEAFLIVADLN